jgi:hypothetical protein
MKDELWFQKKKKRGKKKRQANFCYKYFVITISYLEDMCYFSERLVRDDHSDTCYVVGL